MINVAGVISIVLFYILILAVGIWAGRKKEAGNDSEEEVMLAGRNIGLFVGIFTMTGNTKPNTTTTIQSISISLPQQLHGLVAVTSTAQLKQFTHKAWYGVKHHSVTP